MFGLSLLSAQFSYKPVVLFQGFTEDPHLALPTTNERLGIQPRASRVPGVRVRQVGPEGLEGKGGAARAWGLGGGGIRPAEAKLPGPAFGLRFPGGMPFPAACPVLSVLRCVTCTFFFF